MMEYSRIAHQRICMHPLYKRSKVVISDIEVGCIIMAWRNFPHYPNEQINHLTERMFLARLEAVDDGRRRLTNLRAPGNSPHARETESYTSIQGDGKGMHVTTRLAKLHQASHLWEGLHGGAHHDS